MQEQPKHRVIALLAYAVALLCIQYFVVSSQFEPNEKEIWLLNGIAGLLFGSRLLNPHFTPPADAATNGFVAFATLVVATSVVPARTLDSTLLWATLMFCAAVSLAAIVVLLVRVQKGVETRSWVPVVDKAVRSLGSPNTIFTLVILLVCWLFHRKHPVEVYFILAVWTAIVALRPIESMLSLWAWYREQPETLKSDRIVGDIAAYQAPGIVLIRQLGDHRFSRGTPLLVADDNGPWMLGVSLNYVGRDEGNLLRTLTVPLPQALSDRVANLPLPMGSGVALSLGLRQEEIERIYPLLEADRLCGVVDSETTLEHLQFEVIDDSELCEGRLVEVRIGETTTIFQVIDGLTRDEIVQQKNKYGYARAVARKIGRWDRDLEKFVPVKWIPHINSPVFLMRPEQIDPDAQTVGNFPDTSFGVGLSISDAVTHNTAILGILGVGKSYLAVELVERMIASGVKVICLDLTNQYTELLSDFLDTEHEEGELERLVASGEGGVANLNQEQGGSHQRFQAEAVRQLREFIAPASGRFLRIYNPAQFKVTRQASGMFNNNANMATLTPSEITAIITDAALLVCQELGMTDSGRVCLVYEEAHTLVPEWNSVVADGDKAATSRSARAILQGRKYGLGCLLITQRTANVTKTILNQCNTIFAMRTFDDTGREFLSNYIGRDYAGALPALDARHAVLFGKASTCENPVLIRLNDRERFQAVFRPQHPPPPLPQAQAPIAAADVPARANSANDPDDEIPF
ncbi:MAG: DUF87 domain-containing protein [Alphaproteobacteria bacterium]|nr:DUF87 domain-containing protein [Alphaproteobacteria bacterium]